MKKLAILFTIILFTVFANFAQTTAAHSLTIMVPQIHCVALSDSNVVFLDVTSPIDAGDVPIGDTDATKYLRYTVLNPSGVTQQITVAITLGSLPAGTALAVAATDSTPLGVPGSTPITAIAAALITAIPSGYTGIGATDGMLLTYTLSIANAALLEENGAGDTVTVTYTILDS